MTYSTPKRKPAFFARARYYDNRKNKKDGRQPDWKVLTEFTPEEAVKAAEWLINMADHCQINGGTIRKYDRQGNWEEVPGFTMSHAFWQERPAEGDALKDDGTPLYPRFSGSLKPLPPQAPQQQEKQRESLTPPVTDNCPVTPPAQPPVDGCPMPEPKQEKVVAAISWG